MAVVKHTHKLRRHEHSNGEQIYFCVLDCDYKIKVALALGKTTLCNKCNKPFVINSYTIRLAKPICTKCKAIKSPKIDLSEVMHGQIDGQTEPSYPGRPDDTGDLLSRLRKTISHDSTVAVEDFDESSDDPL